MINENIYNELTQDLEEKKGELDASLFKMEKFFKPYFKDKIYVDHQPSDGFIIIVEFENSGLNAPNNIPIEYALKTIEEYPRHYIDCDF